MRWKREAFEQSLADYYEVKVVFVDHQALVVPESARPNPGGDEILRMIGGVDAEFLAGKMQSLAYGLNMAKPIESLAADGELRAYRHRGFWQPMDALRDVRTLEALWDSGKAPWAVWTQQRVLDEPG